MKTLLHTCCGPCSIYPVKTLREKGMDVMGFYYRHNIHPFKECMRRETTLKTYSEKIGMKMIWQKGYELEDFIRDAAFREGDRCIICYHKRLNATALLAKRGKFDAFSTTLLYSKFQNHELLKKVGEAAGKKAGIRFVYHDFREGWKDGIEESKRLEMYRQSYCGCIYSEKERFFSQGRK